MKILIVKIGAIGDVVMAMPVLPYIKSHFPQAQVSWLCGDGVAPLLAQTGLVDEIVTVQEKKLLAGSPPEKLGAILKTWKKLAFRKFDLVLYYYYSPAYKLLIAPCRVGILRAFNRTKNKRLSPIPGRHHSFEYISLFVNEDGSHAYPAQCPHFQYKNPDHLEFRTRLAGKKLVVLSCGGARNALRNNDVRRWPIENYVAVARKLIEMNCEIALTGAPSDEWILPHFEGISYHNFVSKLGLVDFVSLLSVADCVVTHDSGPLHLADLAGTPSVGLFGPTSPLSFRSLHPQSETLWGGEHLTCRPCYDGRDFAACSRAVCMESIEVEIVLQKVQKILTT